jgi:phenylacetate-CoA ligase
MKAVIFDSLMKLRGRDYRKQYEVIKSTSPEDRLARNRHYLDELLLHASSNVPYYARLLNDAGAVNNGHLDLSKFEAIPLLDKNILRKHMNELRSNDYMTRDWHSQLSGGSTGEPARFIHDREHTNWGNAMNYYYYKDMLGIDTKTARKVILWGFGTMFTGIPQFKTNIEGWLTNTIRLNAITLGANDLNRYIDQINAFEPELIIGWPGALYALCLYAERENRSVHTPRIMVSAGETLTEVMKNKIETVFRTRLYNFYGSREISNLAGECREGLLHSLGHHLEVLDENNRPVKEGQEGKVVVTCLHNYSMPFIRYQIGDMAVRGPDECGCGNPMPTLSKVTGRITDYFKLADGTAVPANYFIHLIDRICKHDFVSKFQVIQEEHDSVKIIVVKQDEPKDDDIAVIEEKIRQVMDIECKITWEFVDEIAPTKSGKHLYTKSLVWEPDGGADN